MEAIGEGSSKLIHHPLDTGSIIHNPFLQNWQVTWKVWPSSWRVVWSRTKCIFHDWRSVCHPFTHSHFNYFCWTQSQSGQEGIDGKGWCSYLKIRSNQGNNYRPLAVILEDGLTLKIHDIFPNMHQLFKGRSISMLIFLFLVPNFTIARNNGAQTLYLSGAH